MTGSAPVRLATSPHDIPPQRRHPVRRGPGRRLVDHLEAHGVLQGDGARGCGGPGHGE